MFLKLHKKDSVRLGLVGPANNLGSQPYTIRVSSCANLKPNTASGDILYIYFKKNIGKE
jgi:hypothetical protein